MSNLARSLGHFFSALSDETRIKILVLLHSQPLTVNEIRNHLGEISLPGVSYQLKILQNQDLVRYEKHGRSKVFHLFDSHVVHILNDAITHLTDDHACFDTGDCHAIDQLKQVIENV